MIESWIQECSELAPYLKEKLAADKDHTWLTAPYIHQKVRDVLAEHKPAEMNARLGYIPMHTSFDEMHHLYPWTSYGGGGGYGYASMLPHHPTVYSMLTAQAQFDAQIRRQEQLLTQQIQQQQLGLLLNMTRPY